MKLTYGTVIVTPVYEDVKASSVLFRELANVFGTDLFVLAVDDGSVLEPLGVEGILSAGLDGAVLRLRRNVGHQRAIAIGLSFLESRLADSTSVVVLDADGEDAPSSIPRLLEILASDDVDVTVAGRKSRVENLRFRAFYLVYRLIFQLFTGRRIGFGNFMALKASAVRRLVTMNELGIHVAACVLVSKLRIRICPLGRGHRYSGASKMNFVSLALHGFRALMVFAEDVLVRVGIACAAVAGLTILGAVAAVALKLLGIATPGWFSIALGILFLVFLQTGTLTLVSLMLTGAQRSLFVLPKDRLRLVDEVILAGSGLSE